MFPSGWDHSEVERRSAELAAGMKLMKAWASRVAPAHEDAHPVPDNAEAIDATSSQMAAAARL